MIGNLEQVRQFLRADGDILVVTHFSPDGDAIGSLLTFSGMLDQMGVKHLIGIDGACPDRYGFMPGFERIRNLQANPLPRIFARLVILDAGALPRIGSAQDCIGGDTLVLNIDHHFTGPLYGNINLVDVNAAATAEILYDLCHALSIEINFQIACGLYVGILADTGRFRFANTNARSLKICGDLVDLGVDPGWVTENVYYNQQFDSFQALASALANAELLCDGLVCLIHLDRQFRDSDTEGFVEHAASVRGVALATFIREMDEGMFKVSLRSRCRIDVAMIARKFGGGGHLKAAGFRYKGTKSELVNILLEELKLQIEQQTILNGADFLDGVMQKDHACRSDG
jgi:phosphoesterase RecJ-like protein